MKGAGMDFSAIHNIKQGVEALRAAHPDYDEAVTQYLEGVDLSSQVLDVMVQENGHKLRYRRTEAGPVAYRVKNMVYLPAHPRQQLWAGYQAYIYEGDLVLVRTGSDGLTVDAVVVFAT